MGLGKLQKLNTHDAYWTKLLSDIVARVQSLCPSAKVYIFGSFVKNLFNAESDLDLAIILPDAVDIKDFQLKIRSKGPLSPWPLDLVVVSQSRFQERKDYGGVCMEIASEGVELYPTWKLTNVPTEK